MEKVLRISLKKKSEYSSYLIVDKDSHVSQFRDEKLLRATVYKDKLWNHLIAFSARELSQHFSSLELSRWTNTAEWRGWEKIGLKFADYSGRRQRQIDFSIQPDTELWDRPYNLTEYAVALKTAVKNNAGRGVRYYEADEVLSNGFGVLCRFKADEVPISDQVEHFSRVFAAARLTAIETLSARARENAITTFFCFPAEIKTACEQYLLYFVQFLEDLGVRAKAEIKEDAHNVLFSVTPCDGVMALQRVRQALEVYLRLPDAPNFQGTVEQSPSLAVHQLGANVLHLQSQLLLAKASLQAQDATIEALRLSNYQYRQLLPVEKDAESDKEALLGDTIYVTKVDGKGLHIDLPLIFKRMKRVFGIGRSSEESPHNL